MADAVTLPDGRLREALQQLVRACRAEYDPEQPDVFLIALEAADDALLASPLHAGAEPEERDGNVVTSVRVNRRPSDDAFRFFTGGTIELLRLSRADALRVASDIIELTDAALSSSRAASSWGIEDRTPEGQKLP